MNKIQWPKVVPPIADKIPYVREIHGEKVADDYYWLNAYFKKTADSDKVIKYLEAENAYTDAMMADTKPLQASLFNEMKARILEEDASVPLLKNGYWYYTRTEEGKQYYKYCRRKGTMQAPEEILLDVDKMAEGKPYYAIGGKSISPDNHLLCFGVDEVSRRQYTLYVKNLVTGEVSATGIANTEGSVAWANDNKTFFYTANNPQTLLTEKIMRHELGTMAQQDKTMYVEKDNSNYIGVWRSKNGRWIFISSEGTLSSEVHFLSAGEPDASFKVFASRMPNVKYDVEAHDTRFFIKTNLGATNYKIMSAPLTATESRNWKDFLPYHPGVLTEAFDVFNNFLVVQERQHGLANISVAAITATGAPRKITFPEPAYSAGITAGGDYTSGSFRYTYTSFITPASVYEYNVYDNTTHLLKQNRVLGNYNPADYESKRLNVKTSGGVLIPVSLVYKKGLVLNGQAPLLLYAYGSYGMSMDVYFSSANLSLLNRGFVYAIAHVRGGEELGREWYEAGKLLQKKNTFTDFINVAEYLCHNGYTSPRHLYAQGGSAGGLLMGAVANMAPRLFNGIVAQVPFVDVVNTMLDASIPLTTNEYDEWGNPANEEAYHYMKSYSPYENVTATDYPNMLVTTGLHDSQVQYFEPAKWVARLRQVNTAKHKAILLKTDMDYGHGGASGRFDYLKDVALVYAFLLRLEGINQ